MPHTWGPKATRRLQSQAETPAVAGPAPAPRLRVLFVCVGNSCRSQMAEGFATHYGRDVFEVSSAGLAPAALIAPLTRKTMFDDKDIDLSRQFPKSIFDVQGPFDLIVNMSGLPLPASVTAPQVRTWTVEDPVTGNESVHVRVANQIEALVQQLILDIRARRG